MVGLPWFFAALSEQARSSVGESLPYHPPIYSSTHQRHGTVGGRGKGGGWTNQNTQEKENTRHAYSSVCVEASVTLKCTDTEQFVDSERDQKHI